MKNWKKRWEDELNHITPTLHEEVKNEPISVAQEVKNRPIVRAEEELPWYKKLFSTPKRIAAFASACGVCALTLGLSLAFGLQPKGGDGAVSAAGAVSVQINPEVVFSIDEDGKVSAVAAMNTDADVILSDSARVAAMKGKPVADAVKTFVDYAARLGYLDLSSPDAVRVTSCTDEDTAEIIGDCLQDYFCEKGAYIVVVEESVGVAEFAEYIGLAVDTSIESLTESIQSLTAPYFTRYAESQVDKTFEDLYFEQVKKSELEKTVKGLLQEHVEKIRKHIADVQAISAQEQAIRKHADNPMWILGDYWTVKSRYATEEFTADFASCMSEMENLLTAYERDYGKQIVSALDFQRVVDDCNAMPLETLTELLVNFTAELFAGNSAYIQQLLQNIGVDVSQLFRLYEAPESADAYLEKMNEFVLMRYQELEERGKEAYEKVRTEIDKSEYSAHIESLIEEYGSLQAYWEFLQN